MGQFSIGANSAAQKGIGNPTHLTKVESAVVFGSVYYILNSGLAAVARQQKRGELALVTTYKMCRRRGTSC